MSPAGTPSRRAFILSRIGSLLGVLPLGVWVFVHLWNNLAAFSGAEAWQIAVTDYPHPTAQAVVFTVVLLPLAIHTIWGIGRLRTSRPLLGTYTYFANIKYLVQRLSAIGLLLFLGAHLWLAMLRPRLVVGHAEQFEDIAHEMHFHGPTLVVYLLGTLAASYHLANGLWTFLMGFGVVGSQRALRRFEWLAVAVGVVLLAMSWGAIFALWQAGAST